MPSCAAKGCKNKSSCKSKAQLDFEKHTKITFHRFPKKIDVRKMWINRMGLTEASLPKYPHLCLLHFSSESFDLTSACKVRLKDAAVPFIHDVQGVADTGTNRDTVVLQEMSVNVENVVGKETMKIEKENDEINMNVDNVVGKEAIECKRSRENDALTVDEVEESTNKKQKIDILSEGLRKKIDASMQTSPQPTSVDKATWVSKSFLADSPTKMHLRDIIKNQKVSYEKRIKVLKQTVQRKTKRIETLKNALTDLKKNIKSSAPIKS